MGVHPWLLGAVKSCYKLQRLEDPPPLSPCPVSCPLLSQVGAAEALDLEITSLIEKGVVEVVLSGASPGFFQSAVRGPKVNRRVASRP